MKKLLALTIAALLLLVPAPTIARGHHGSGGVHRSSAGLGHHHHGSSRGRRGDVYPLRGVTDKHGKQVFRTRK
jgi:hypothetical protein